MIGWIEGYENLKIIEKNFGKNKTSVDNIESVKTYVSEEELDLSF